LRAGDNRSRRAVRRRAVSRPAIAAVLARDDLAGGERLVAFSLASFAGRDDCAWPGASIAAARAGLSRSRYLMVRDRLVARGLVVVESEASGRGRSSLLALPFVSVGPWWEAEINAELCEAVLSRTRRRGPARLLLAAMAALADADGVVTGLSKEELCAAAGVEDRTYRRARGELLECGEVELVEGGGGRGNTNVWQLRTLPGAAAAAPPVRRVAAPVGARPLLATVAAPAGENCPVVTGVPVVKGGQDRTVSEQNCPVWSGVSESKGGQDRTLFDETPTETPAETPAPNARAGKEPQNPRTREDPPNPPAGGSSSDSILIEKTYITARGRKRRRHVRVDLDELRRGLGLSTLADRGDWERVRALLRDAVGESTFDIWLDQVELIAVDGCGVLVLAVNEQTASWVRERFGRLLADCVERTGREFRFASEPERRALGEHQDQRHPAEVRALKTDQKEAI
jgi:hypothetical protein